MGRSVKAWLFSTRSPRWARVEYGPGLRLCFDGLHQLWACERLIDALVWGDGNFLQHVAMSRDITRYGARVHGHQRETLWAADASSVLDAFARWCALRVSTYWRCPKELQRYLESGDQAQARPARVFAFECLKHLTSLGLSSRRIAIWSAIWASSSDPAWIRARNASADAASAVAWRTLRSSDDPHAWEASLARANQSLDRKLGRLIRPLGPDRRNDNGSC